MLIPRRSELEDQTIIHGRNNAYIAHNPTPGLSIKCMFNGQALYEIEGARFVVSDGQYLILNANQPYTITIDSPTIVNSFCVFFPTDWAADVLHSLQTPSAEVLDKPSAGIVPHFFERLYPYDQNLIPAVLNLRTRLSSDAVTAGWLEERLRTLLAELLHVHDVNRREIERIDAARYATRVELYQRLYRARDYMHACMGDPLSLEEIAGIAYLSPYHFLRAFKQLFGQTPHAYLTQQRLERAQFLLNNTSQSVTEICLTIGFESLGSFSTLFNRRFGVSPRAFRQHSKSAILEK